MSTLMRWLTSPAYQMAAMTSDTVSVLRRESRYRDVPAVEPKIGLIGEAILDGTFSLMVNLLVGVPEAQVVRRGHQEMLAMRDFLERNGWLQDPAGYHREPPALRAPQISKKTTGSLGRRSRYQELSFESEFEPHPGEPGRERWLAHDDNGTALAYVLEHTDRDRPWLVCTHGFSMGHASVNMAGLSARWIHEDLGLNVLMPVLPLHGPRSSTRFSGGGLLQPDLVSMLHVFSQSVWDIRRLIQWLRSRTQSPIGLYGISLGGYAAALASAFVDDLACVIAGIPAVDFTSLARDNEPWAYKAYGGDLQTDWSLVQNVMFPVSPLSFEPRVPRERRFIYAGVADRVARPDQARALWRHWGKPEIAWLPSGHVIASLKSDMRPFLRGIVRDHLQDPGLGPRDADAVKAEDPTASAG
ncbi:MAG: alpha/beta hydrolase family protein [bacterium]